MMQTDIQNLDGFSAGARYTAKLDPTGSIIATRYNKYTQKREEIITFTLTQGELGLLAYRNKETVAAMAGLLQSVPAIQETLRSLTSRINSVLAKGNQRAVTAKDLAPFQDAIEEINSLQDQLDMLVESIEEEKCAKT